MQGRVLFKSLFLLLVGMDGHFAVSAHLKRVTALHEVKTREIHGPRTEVKCFQQWEAIFRVG